MKLNISEKPGLCRWCGCTERHACDGGCSWANDRRTLCTACLRLDRLMRSRPGRMEIAQLVVVLAVRP